MDAFSSTTLPEFFILVRSLIIHIRCVYFILVSDDQIFRRMMGLR